MMQPTENKDIDGSENLDRKRKNNREESGRPKGGSGRHRHAVLQNPKRGAPGILLTCEQGKERKCQREGLEIIEHYYSKFLNENDGNGDRTSSKAVKATLSLDEELKHLQDGKEEDSSELRFGIFQTGCRGTVFAMCTAPGSEMIPSVKEQKKNRQTGIEDGDNTADVTETDEPIPKKQRVEATEDANDGKKKVITAAAVQTSSFVADNPKWDPVPIVRQIIQDIETDTARDAPSSRFVTRMVPIQATCFASQEELQIASRLLIQRYFPLSSAKTFGIIQKRRMCPDRLSKQTIIDIVVAEVLAVAPNIKVNLNNPDVTVAVEVCKTLCGISVISNCKQLRNFNLAVARDEKNEKHE